MSVILGCITEQHDLPLLLVALGLCIFSCITARAMVLRAFAAEGAHLKSAWLVGAGTVAGAGVWATHFVAMLALVTGMPMAFAPGFTILSAVLAMAVSGAGFALSFSRAGGAVGGMVVGIGILGMHYIGMAAIRLPADAIWNPALVLASVVIGISVGGLAGHFAALPVTRAHNVITVILRAATILGVHFTGMGAVRFVPDSAHAVNPMAMSPLTLSILVTSVAAFLVGQALVLALVDRYLSARAKGDGLRMRAYIAELEATQSRLQQTSGELSSALDAAEAASKSKSAFLASMSHELRTPLNAVIGFSEMITLEPFGKLGSPRYKEYLHDIHASGAHLLSLINDILDISRYDAGQGQLQDGVFDLTGEITETMRMVSVQAAKAGVAMVSDIASGLPRINADRRRIRQILLNLMSNALKFTPEAGTVTVHAWVEAEGLVLQVADTGIGIAPQDFAKALEPFGQVDSSLARKYEGTGLGLPLTRQMAELHGGSLALESTPGLGTTVTVRLPAWRLAPGDCMAA